MTFNWTQLKEAITEETLDVFEANSTVSVSEALEIFRKVIDFPVEGIAFKLAGLPDLWQAFTNILVNNDTSLSNFKALATNFEAYLKKILYLTNEAYYTANANYLTLGDKFDKNKVMVSQGLISKLQLNQGNYQYWLSTPITATKNYANHLWRAYNTRNDESHFAPPRNRKQYWECVQSYLVMYLWAAYKHKQAILSTVEPYYLSTYLQNYISEFHQWQRLFVALDGVERPELLLDNFAVEVPHTEQSKQGEAQPDNSSQPDSSKKQKQSTVKRSGSVMELRKKIAEKEKQMVIIAEPGMGKSTALQYLAYIDAIAIEQGDTATPYPVYLELKEFQAKDNIKERIVRQWGISPDITEQYLQKGNITLLLDGLNETSENLRHEAVNAIRRFMIDYPKVLVILTCRPNAYEHKYFDQIPGRAAKQTPVFQLQPMGMAQIEEFLTNYCATDTVRQIILNALHENEYLRRVVQTPLLLKMLIALVSRQPQAPLPPTEPSIVLNFIEGIHQREAERDAGFSPKLLQKLLPIMAHQTRMQHQANITLPPAAICQMLQNEAPKWEIEATLYKAEELHLLVRNPLNNHYSFTHELYQETLWAYQQTRYDQYPPTAPMLYQPAIELWHQPAFAQALRLYAGLLHGEARKQFIQAIAQRNAYLAARCTTAYWQPEEAIKQLVVERAELFAVFFDTCWEWCAQGFLALIELEAYEAVGAALLTYEEEIELGVTKEFTSTTGKQSLEAHEAVGAALLTYEEEIVLGVTKEFTSATGKQSFAEYLRAMGGFRAMLTLFQIILEKCNERTINEMVQSLYTIDAAEEALNEPAIRQIAQYFKEKEHYANLFLLDLNMQTLYLCTEQEIINLLYHKFYLDKYFEKAKTQYSELLPLLIDKYRLPERLPENNFNDMMTYYIDNSAMFIYYSKYILDYNLHNVERFQPSILHLYAKYELPFTLQLPLHSLSDLFYIENPNSLPLELLTPKQRKDFIEMAVLFTGEDGIYEAGLFYAYKYDTFDKSTFQYFVQRNLIKDDNLIQLIAEKYGIPFAIPTELERIKYLFNDSYADFDLFTIITLIEEHFVQNGLTKLEFNSETGKLVIGTKDKPIAYIMGHLMNIAIENIFIKTTENATALLSVIKKYKLQEYVELRKIVHFLSGSPLRLFRREESDKVFFKWLCHEIEELYGVQLSEEQIEMLRGEENMELSLSEILHTAEYRYCIVEEPELPQYLVAKTLDMTTEIGLQNPLNLSDTANEIIRRFTNYNIIDVYKLARFFNLHHPLHLNKNKVDNNNNRLRLSPSDMIGMALATKNIDLIVYLLDIYKVRSDFKHTLTNLIKNEFNHTVDIKERTGRGRISSSYPPPPPTLFEKNNFITYNILNSSLPSSLVKHVIIEDCYDILLRSVKDPSQVLITLQEKGKLTESIVKEAICYALEGAYTNNNDKKAISLVPRKRPSIEIFTNNNSKKAALKKLLQYLPRLLPMFHLQEEYPLTLFLEKAIKIDVAFAKTWAAEFGLLNHYPPHFWVEHALEHNLQLALQWLQDYGLEADYPSHILIEKALDLDKHWAMKQIFKYGLPKQLPIETVLEAIILRYNYGFKYPVSLAVSVLELIEKYQISNRFLIVSFCLNILSSNSNFSITYSIVQGTFEVDWKNEVPETFITTIQKGYGALVKEWTDRIIINDIITPSFLVQTALDTQQTEVAEHWVQKYNLYNEFPQFEPPANANTNIPAPPGEA